MKRSKGKKIFFQVLMYGFLGISAFLSVFPLYWSFVSAFNSTQDILGGRMLPGNQLIENLTNLFQQQNVWRAMRNSFATAITQTVLALLVSSIAGYGFEIFHDKAKDRVMGFLMLAMMVPLVALLVPLFRLFSSMGLLNTWTAFILPGIATPFLIMFFRNSARSFPRDTLEAARIDGLTEVGIFFRMFVPMMRPTYAAAATITFMGAWNAYLWPKVINQTADSFTMPMMVANTMGGYVIDYGIVMAAVSITSLPTIIIFFLLQKSFTEAVAGAVK